MPHKVSCHLDYIDWFTTILPNRIRKPYEVIKQTTIAYFIHRLFEKGRMIENESYMALLTRSKEEIAKVDVCL